MAAVRQPPDVSIPKQPKEAIPISKKPIRRIRRISESWQAALELGYPTSPLKFVFGPLYRTDNSDAYGKEDAWRRVLEDEREDPNEITGIYVSAMRRIEKKARAAYDDATFNDLTEREFRWMMIKDGCFFLHLALYILGASKELGYTKNHLIFGEKQSKKTLQEWRRSMFLVGNQIPLVVLNELMKQNFFQKIIKGMEWPRPSDMLSKQILHDLLVIPAQEYSNSEQPSDLLHGLQLLLLGRSSRTYSTENEGQDELEDEDLEAGIKFESSPTAEERESKKKLSASELRNKGIFISKSKTEGIREIHFRNRIIFASLTLPTLKVNHDTNVLFTNLKYYEVAQQQNEVRSYLRFLSELISTYEDVNVLASKGIIEASTSDEKARFLKMLKTLAVKETTHHQHSSVLGRVEDYSIFPWERFKYVGIIIFFLTIAQTVFSVLGYGVGLKQLRQGPRG